MRVATEFLGDAKRASDGEQITTLHSIEKATDYCAIKHKEDADNYVCPHFRRFLDQAFHDLDDSNVSDRTITVKRFCVWAENHYDAMSQQVTTLQDIAEGNDILHFKISEKCPAAVAEAIEPKEKLPKEKVPDFWYALCVSQDCAHYLPSRTKWCSINLPHPRHSIEVCELAREYAKEDAANFNGDEMNPEEICASYGRFMDEVRLTVEAYAHVMHGASRKDIPVPEDQIRALTSSKLLNDAAGHHLRDHAAHKVIPFTETKEEPYYHSAATTIRGPMTLLGGLGLLFLIIQP